ncbi:unnamed protein product [Durusdinium trenchii]|uniref:CDK5 regulatory subunit-associated protein 3 n=2 Tax=Durusdinium trenchii TaxID=1381693 RepID=A0ABP0M5Q0_9DINO
MSADFAIQYGKLIEWLLARRVIPEDYTKLLSAVQARISEAQKEQFTDEVARAVISEHGDNVHYLAAKRIYEAILNSPEGQSKTLLGGHTHAGAAKWKAVLDAYRRRHLGWASAARFLIQNVSYEMAALTKHAAFCERQVQDCTTRQADLDRQEANATARYCELLNDLGIEGFNFRKELRQRSGQDLRALSREALDLLRQVGQETVTCYQIFAEYAAGRPLDGEVLPFIRALLGEELPSMEALEHQVPDFRSLRAERGKNTSLESQEAEMDHSGLPKTDGAIKELDGIDWGITCTDDGSGINWNFEEEKEVSAEAEAGVSSGIDWSAVSFEGVEIAVEGTVDEVDGESPFLADAAARELLAREVAEAVAFLSERSADLAQGGAASEEYGPKIEQSLAEVETLWKTMVKLENLLSSRSTQRLVLLASSKRYLDRTAKRVEMAQSQCGKSASRKAELEKVKAEQLLEVKRSRAETKQLQSVIREVKEDLEAELTAHFKSNVRILNTA